VGDTLYVKFSGEVFRAAH